MLELTGIDHVGVRVSDADRAVAFYQQLGFVVTARYEAERVIILRHAVGIEVNLIVNAERSEQGNVLLDAPVKHPGYTHLALRVPDVRRAHEQAQALGFNISEGPLQLGDGWSFFVRDPDGNVIELRAPGP